MCNTCGCNITPGNRPLIMQKTPKNGVTTVSVLQNLLSQNNHQASIIDPILMPIKCGDQFDVLPRVWQDCAA